MIAELRLRKVVCVSGDVELGLCEAALHVPVGSRGNFAVFACHGRSSIHAVCAKTEYVGDSLSTQSDPLVQQMCRRLVCSLV